MLEGEYLELCNDLKVKYDELKDKEREIERTSYRLKRSITFYASMVMALEAEILHSGMDGTTVFNSIMDILAHKIEEDMQSLLHSSNDTPTLHIRFQPVVVQSNLPPPPPPPPDSSGVPHSPPAHSPSSSAWAGDVNNRLTITMFLSILNSCLCKYNTPFGCKCQAVFLQFGGGPAPNPNGPR